MRNEKSLQAYITKKCAAKGILCYKLRASSQRGLPDLMLLHDGKALFIEVKSPAGTGRMTELQKRMQARLRAAGFVAADLASVEATNNFFAEHFPELDTWRELI
jgi:hypothetical protein